MFADHDDYIAHRPQRRTKCRFGVEVSSVKYSVNGMHLDETCVFRKHDSEVVGAYADHDDIVARYGAI